MPMQGIGVRGMKLYGFAISAAVAALVAAASAAAQTPDPCIEGLTCPEQPPAEQAPAEQPPPDPCPTQESQGHGLFVGMVSDQLFADPTPEYRRCSLNKHAEVGVRIIRQALRWSEIETKRDVYEWGYWDQYVLDLARHRIEVMPILFEAPRWRQQQEARRSARRNGNTWASVPPKNAAMASFAARLVRRYG